VSGHPGNPKEQAVRYFTIGDENAHRTGDAACTGCAEEYPEPCICGGMIHAEPGGPEDETGEILLVTRCDQCGRSEDEVTEELGRQPP
jgi:hypothetical protein